MTDIMTSLNIDLFSWDTLYIMNNRGPRIDPWGTPCFCVPQAVKKFLVVLGDFTLTFCLLSVKQDLSQSPYTPQIP